MKVYKNLKIPACRFYYILNNNDPRALVSDFDIDEDNNSYVYDGDEDLNDIFNNIFYKYCELTGDKTLLTMFKSQLQISNMELEYCVVSKIIGMFNQYENVDFLISIEKFYPSYKIHLNKDLNIETSRLLNKLKGLQNRINIKKINYEEKYKSKSESNIKIDVQEIASSIEIALDLRYQIDDENITLSRIVKMIKLANKKHKKNGTNSNNSSKRLKRTK